jgi:predicted nucleic acid-binding protein
VSFAVMVAEPCDAVFSVDRDFAVAGFRVWRGER